MNRTFLFWGGCIPLRLALVYAAYVVGKSDKYSKVGAALALLLGISFIVLWAAHLRQNAPEGGGITWWDNIRPVHGSIWIIAGLMLLCPKVRKYAWTVLLLDVCVGITVHINHTRAVSSL